jgi:ABC-2 type transport system permease protein
MKNFLTVLRFEYSNYVKSKAYIIITAVMLALIIVLSFLPGLSVSSVFQSGTEADAAFLLGTEARAAGMEDYVNAETLTKAVPDYRWKASDVADPKRLILDGKAKIAVYYDGGGSYDFYASGSDMGSLWATSGLEEFFTGVEKQVAIAALPAVQQEDAGRIAGLSVHTNVVEVKGDANQNFWFAYVLIFFLYMTIIMYGQYVINSVVTEKSSRAMELLITSARPSELMFGKVIAVALVALTQLALLAAMIALMVKLNLASWEQTIPGLSSIFSAGKVSLPLILCFAIYYLLGYFLYAFLLAALGSTISRVEDASAVSTLPILMMVAALILSIVGMAEPNSTHNIILSYIPFFTPWVMFGRICMAAAGPLEAVLGILDLGLSVFLMGILATKIYRAGVMLYGKPLKLTTIGRIIIGR